MSRSALTGTKANAQYLCPRCLIIKGDIPQIGTDLDMKRRSSNVREYPPDRIEDARKALFESGQSVGYKGPLEILKDGSWAPTRVCLVLVPVLVFF